MKWISDALEIIKSLELNHPAWELAKARVHAALIAAAPGEVVVLTGPSRVGKTKLLKEILFELVGEEKTWAEGTLPVISIMTTNCGTNGSFNTKSFTIRALQAVKHPVYGEVLPYDEWGVKQNHLLENTGEPALYRAFELSIVNRKVKYIFLDEAQHILFVQGGVKNAAAILSTWKCLAQEKDVVLVLAGAYPLLDVIQCSAHLLGRKHSVHFPRYSTEEADMYSFASILEEYSKFICFPKGVKSLCEWGNYLYKGSLGCIGLFEIWLRSALAMAKAENSECLLRWHFEEALRTNREMHKIATEIMDGEKYLEKHNKDKEFDPFKKKSKHKPFTKKPRRYPVEDRV